MMPPGVYSDIERPKVNQKKKMMNMSGPIRKKKKPKWEKRKIKGSLLPESK
jgi:hypothetical protein